MLVNSIWFWYNFCFILACMHEEKYEGVIRIYDERKDFNYEYLKVDY